MTDWFSGDVIANGIRIHYYRTGGAKPPVVLSHGFSDNGLCWTRLAQVLQKDYDLVMPDARGHGLSDAPAEGYTTDDRAADLAGLIQALGLQKPALMGHSMGAATTAVTAVRYPHLMSRIVLEDPPWFEADSAWLARRPAMSPEQRKAEILARKSQTREQVMAAGRQQSPAWDEVEFGPWADAKLQLSPNVVPAVEEKRAHWSEIVPGLKCPTLLVIGDPQMHAIVSLETAHRAAEMNPLIQVVQLNGAGHNIRREQFAGFVQAVTSFLSARNP